MCEGGAHVAPRSRLTVCSTPLPSFQMRCTVPFGATLIHGRSLYRARETVDHRHVEPASGLTPTASCTPSCARRSYVICTKYNVPSGATARSTSEFPTAPSRGIPTFTSDHVAPRSLLFHRRGRMRL